MVFHGWQEKFLTDNNLLRIIKSTNWRAATQDWNVPPKIMDVRKLWGFICYVPFQNLPNSRMGQVEDPSQSRIYLVWDIPIWNCFLIYMSQWHSHINIQFGTSNYGIGWHTYAPIPEWDISFCDWIHMMK
jgi:hypothetical protein